MLKRNYSKSKKKSAIKPIPEQVIIRLNVLFTNTRIDITDINHGGVYVWGSSGSSGFKGGKKKTPYAAAVVVKSACDKAYERGARTAILKVYGAGQGRDMAIRMISEHNIKITKIEEIIIVAHNGTRPKKEKRV